MERREYSMWNCDWEYENQETLKQWYEEKLAGIRPYSAVRKIICKGCGKTFTLKRSDAVYCCNACRQRAFRQNVTDKVCGQIDPLPQP